MAAITPVVEKNSIVPRRDVSKEEVLNFGTIDIISLLKKNLKTYYLPSSKHRGKKYI